MMNDVDDADADDDDDEEEEEEEEIISHACLMHKHLRMHTLELKHVLAMRAYFL